MQLLYNAEHAAKLKKALRRLRAAFEGVPSFDPFVQAAKEYASTRQALTCLSVMERKGSPFVGGVYSIDIPEHHLEASTTRFNHYAKDGDFLPLKKCFRRYLLQGTGLVCVDVHCQEPVIAATLAGEERVTRLYADGGDVYAELARCLTVDSEAFRRDVEDSSDAARTVAKRGFNAWLNGARDRYGLRKVFPRIDEFRRGVIERATKEPLTLCDGVQIPPYPTDEAYKAWAGLIQGNGAAVLRRALAALDAEHIDTYGHLHDSIYCLPDDVEAVKAAFNSTDLFVFRFSVEET